MRYLILGCCGFGFAAGTVLLNRWMITPKAVELVKEPTPKNNLRQPPEPKPDLPVVTLSMPSAKVTHKAPSPRVSEPQPQIPVVINSPDPYVGTSNQIVAQWATELAERLEKTGSKCREDVSRAMERKHKGIPITLPDAPGPEYVQVMFRREFDKALKPAIIDTHQSLTFRLGPSTLNESVQSDYEGKLISATHLNDHGHCA